MSAKFTIVALFLLSTLSLKLASAQQIMGTADFIEPPYGEIACDGDKQDASVLLAGVNATLYDNGKACGQMYKVTCLSGHEDADPKACIGSKTVMVKVVDLCDPCETAISLYLDAFKMIAKEEVGVINASIERVIS